MEAELKAPSAQVQLVHSHFAQPPRSRLRVDGRFRIEHALTARQRTTRACFFDNWGQYRFERVGELFILPPGVTMVTRSDAPGSLTSIVCEFKSELILQFAQKLPQLNEELLVDALDIRNSRVQGLLLRLADEIRHPDFASEMVADSIAAQLAVELVRHGTAMAERGTRGGLAPWQLRIIDERLKEVRETPTLDALASLCRISVRQLGRGFRASRGCPLGAHVAKSQMEHAKHLLAAGGTLTSIASALGYSSPSNFCVAFRRAMGMTPGQFRRTLLRR